MEADARRRGVLYAVVAYSSWGVFPLYWKLLSGIPSLQVLGHRIFWSALFLGGLVSVRRRGELWGRLASGSFRKRELAALGLSALLISTNWLVFIYAVSVGRVLESSLGYFLSPLMSVLMGVLFLHERLRRGQWMAVALAGVGVFKLGWDAGGLPWIALALALTFCLYGFVRKKVPIEPLVASTLEAWIMVLPALVLLAWPWVHPASGADGAGLFGLGSLALLALGGPITALPLLWFTEAGKRLPLSTVGFFQYISPTMQFLAAVVIFGEPFGGAQLVGFGLIWTALGIYVLDVLRASRS